MAMQEINEHKQHSPDLLIYNYISKEIFFIRVHYRLKKKKGRENSTW